MTEAKAHDLRQATSERNAESILDAAEKLIQSGRSATISAVAAESGVSRVTIYSHFGDRQHLLEAVVERTVRRAMAAIEPARPELGPPIEALERLVEASWKELARNSEIRRASAAELSADGVRRVHESAHSVLQALIERGRSDGSFRTDVPAGWLVTSLLALIHGAADDVRDGRLEPAVALGALTATVVDLFRGRTSNR